MAEIPTVMATKCQVYYPPKSMLDIQNVHVFNGVTTFLAGSIEQGQAEEWQQWAINGLADLEISIFNPRRGDYDPTWEQTLQCDQFVKQVNWELDHLNKVSIAAFYFAPGTKSPITLMELGLTVADNRHRGPSHCHPLVDGVEPQRIVIYCPKGFWRKGNVDIVAQRANLMVHEDQEKWLLHIRQIAMDQMGMLDSYGIKNPEVHPDSR